MSKTNETTSKKSSNEIANIVQAITPGSDPSVVAEMIGVAFNNGTPESVFQNNEIVHLLKDISEDIKSHLIYYISTHPSNRSITDRLDLFKFNDFNKEKIQAYIRYQINNLKVSDSEALKIINSNQLLKACIYHVDKQFLSELMESVSHLLGKIKFEELLNIDDEEGYTLLYHAILTNNTEKVAILKNYNANFYRYNSNNGGNIINLICENYVDVKMLDYVLEATPDLDINLVNDEKKERPLHSAARIANIPVLVRLIQLGAEDFPDNEGWRSLPSSLSHDATVNLISHAFSMDYNEGLKFLNQLFDNYGIDINTKDSNGDSAAFRAVYIGMNGTDKDFSNLKSLILFD